MQQFTMHKLALLVLLGVTLAKVQSFHFGKCYTGHNIQIMRPFDWTRFEGKWYVRERIPSLFDVTSKCIVKNYTNMTNINTQATLNWRSYDAITQRLTDFNMPMNMYDRSEGGYAIDRPPFLNRNFYVHFLYTDYDNVALAIGCLEFGPFHYDFGWIMTRQRNLQQTSLLDPVYAKLKDINLDRSLFWGVDTTSCPDY